jgi:hypothetical protein
LVTVTVGPGIVTAWVTVVATICVIVLAGTAGDGATTGPKTNPPIKRPMTRAATTAPPATEGDIALLLLIVIVNLDIVTFY